MKWIAIRGYNYKAKNWKEVMWGNSLQKWRITRAIEVAKKEKIKNLIIGSCTFAGVEINQKIHKKIRTKLKDIFSKIVSDLKSKTTIEEVYFISTIVNPKDSLYVVSDYIHLPRCIDIAQKLLNKNKTKIVGFPSDVPYRGTPEKDENYIL